MTGDSEHPPPSQTSGRVFVGRQTELAALQSGLARALAGRGGVCLVAGEPGIGKSELADRLAADAAARGVEVLWGRSWEGEGAPPYWPWAQILRAYVQEREGQALEAIFGAATPYVAQVVPEIRDRLPDLPVPPPRDSEQARFRLFDAITTFLTRAAGTRPLVLVLDDLHWADTPTLLLLRFLARELAGARLLVVATYRDVEVLPGHPLAEVLPSLRQERTVERILLRGLPEDDVQTMLAALRGEQVPEALARAISRETEGNPFFIQEIVRHLVDEGILGRDGMQWTSRSRIEDVRLPESVRDVIGRRLGRLGATGIKVLTAASVVGREFGLEALERIADLEEARLVEALEEAVAARVVEEVPQAIGRYRFAHALIRETLYENLRTLDRVRRHHRVAEVLEALYARKPEPHLAELAHHFLEGLPGGDVDKAVGYATRAGDRANEQLAYEEAAIHYERALQALELREEQPNERLRCELLLKHGEARWSVAFEAMESLEEAANLAERLGDAETFARAALGRAGFGAGLYVMAGDPVQVALLERALGALDNRDGALRARVMGRLSALRVFMGNPHGNASFARSAIEMARRIGDKNALAYVLNTTMWATIGPDDREEGLTRVEELIRLAEEIGDTRLAAEGHLWKASHHLEIGDIAGSDREAEIQERFATTNRQAYHRWLAGLARGARAFIEGRFDEAEAYLKEALEVGSASLTFARAVQGSLTLLREQQGRAIETWPQLASLAARYPLVIWRLAVARVHAATGQPEEARRELESLAANDFADVPRDMTWLYNMSRLSDLVILFGDARQAAILYDLLLPYRDRCVVLGGIAASRGTVSRSLGGLATILSRYDEAERHFEDALEMNARIRARIWVAHTQHDYARMLVARDRPGDRERATVLAAQALATAREVGMKPLEAKLLELRAATGLRDEATAEPAPEGAPTPAAPAAFQREGDFWTIAYEGKRIRLRDAKGLQYIAYLLRHDGRDFHAADLAAGVDAVPAPESAHSHPEGREIAPGLGDAGEVLDAEARTAYRQRLRDLEAELAEATQWADTGRAAKLSTEIEFLREELSSAYGLGGRVRKAGDVGDRARKAVTSRIRESIDRIGKEHPALARHFENAIHTGTFCRYQPDRPLRWEL
jgi:tetratricopeptide (TPR) repeat protein